MKVIPWLYEKTPRYLKPITFTLLMTLLIVVGILVGFLIVGAMYLTGRWRIGPKETWDNEPLRAEFGVRRLERRKGWFHIALGMAVLTGGSAATVAILTDAGDYSIAGVACFVLGAASLMLLCVGMFPILTDEPDREARVVKRMNARLEQPVLFNI